MMVYTGHPEEWGIIPTFMSQFDDDDAVTQIDKNYSHGGGWHDTVSTYTLTGGEDGPWVLTFDVDSDQPYTEVGRTYLREECVVLFPHSWVAVIPLNGNSRVARID